MSDKDEKKPSINNEFNFNDKVENQGPTVFGGTQNIDNYMPAIILDEKKKKKLKEQLLSLEAELKKIQDDKQREAVDELAKTAKELVDEVDTDQKNQQQIDSKANKLKLAAENIQDVLPAVFKIAGSIIAIVAPHIGK